MKLLPAHHAIQGTRYDFARGFDIHMVYFIKTLHAGNVSLTDLAWLSPTSEFGAQQQQNN